MYRVASTGIPGDGFRPWQSRLGVYRPRHRLAGLGVYSPGEFVVPTVSDQAFQGVDYPFMASTATFRPGSVSANFTRAAAALAPAAPAKGVSGLGALDLSAFTGNPLLLAAAAFGAYWLFFRKR